MSYAPTPPIAFVEFAESIHPRWVVSIGNPKRDRGNRLKWLATVWDHTANRLFYSVPWANSELAASLPVEAQQFEFEDTVLHPITASLGLSPDNQDDNCRVAGLMATAEAWVMAIRSYCRDTYTSGESEWLSPELANDYVVLTSDWKHHPWVRLQIERYAEKMADKRRQVVAPPPEEYSTNPAWPDTQVAHATPPPPSAEEEAAFKARQETIGYWIGEFEHEDGRWSSRYEIDAWYAQEDIDVARQKITELEAIIERQSAQIRESERIVRRSKRKETALFGPRNVGRPKPSPERQVIAARFMSQWTRSLMAVLGVDSGAALEATVKGSHQRNWRRWLSGEAVPTVSSFEALGRAEVLAGKYRGHPLATVRTSPNHEELATLLRLAWAIPRNGRS